MHEHVQQQERHINQVPAHPAQQRYDSRRVI
jgi:hypothetical protein